MPKQDDSHLLEVNQEIYKRNLELAVVNKTLSLLRKLYQISLMALTPASLSEKISEAVRVDLNMEAVAVFLFDEPTDRLTLLKLSVSDRLGKALGRVKSQLETEPIKAIKKRPLLNQVIHDRHSAMTDKFARIWEGPTDSRKFPAAVAEAHLQATLLYPLVAQNRVLGLLAFGLNRTYSDLSEHEQESIRSLIDVVAVALDNTLLYEKLGETNKQLVILDRARADFISIASHQLRTPPATIKWYLAAVLAGDYGKLPPKAKAAIEKAGLTNNGLIGLIDDMLNASRIERGKMEFIFERTDIQKLFEAAVAQLVPQATMKKLKLVYRKPRTRLPHILADKEKLQQVANNLIDNAIKYSKKGQITVELKSTGENLVLKVSDSGKGLTAQQHKAIFEKYGRGKNGGKPVSGLGLGLYVAKVVVEHHHGTITADSKGVDKGSTFTVTLPIHTDLKAETFDLALAQ